MLVLVALFLGWTVTRSAFVQVLSRGSPSTALHLDPTNGTALKAAYGQALAKGEMSTGQSHAWAGRARRSVESSPLSASMIRIIATDPTRPRAYQLLGIAERVSRRDALMQLALVEAAVASGQVGQALRHYDRALSVYPDLRPTLFPVLASAIAEPAIRADLARIAYERRPWINSFLAYAARQSASPSSVASLLEQIGSVPGASQDLREHAAVLAGRFVGAEDYASAHQLALRSAGSDAAWIDRPSFAPATWAQPTRPLTWATAETEGVNAQLDPDNAVMVSAGPGSAGMAMFRVLLPRPGRYQFSVTSEPPLDGTAPAGGRWTLFCLRGHGQTAVPLADIALTPGRKAAVAQSIIVPANCAAVRLDFAVDNSEGGTDAGVLLSGLVFTRL